MNRCWRWHCVSLHIGLYSMLMLMIHHFTLAIELSIYRASMYLPLLHVTLYLAPCGLSALYLFCCRRVLHLFVLPVRLMYAIVCFIFVRSPSGIPPFILPFLTAHFFFVLYSSDIPAHHAPPPPCRICSCSWEILGSAMTHSVIAVVL